MSREWTRTFVFVFVGGREGGGLLAATSNSEYIILFSFFVMTL